MPASSSLSAAACNTARKPNHCPSSNNGHQKQTTTPKSASKRARNEIAEEDKPIQKVIDAIMDNWKTAASVALKEDVLHNIILRAREVIMAEEMLVPVEAPVNVCGDLHGQIHDLVEIFKTGGLPPNASYLFLGDYVDRGKHGIECITLLLALKIMNPGHIFLLRGNHETDSICRMYGFFDECKRRYNFKLYKTYVDLFNVLPIAATIEDRALCMHGGLSPELHQLSQIRNLKRPMMIGDTGLACDILWSDPEAGIHGWGYSERGVSCTFGADIVKKFCQKVDLDLIIRAHQVMNKGYEFFADRRLVTVFSASNYCGEFENSGAMLMMDEDLKCRFQVFKPDYD
eukprot:Tbor_TRINITY_DN1103_c0_g1::TRINITY_DN1103_c0_g1_i1::g.15557::m.15557/K06269/PPP1C; serine/threonine-protein phosphatase PP1 catalytic subunit